MGIGGVSVGSLLIILAIVILLFGTKKLRNIGSDLGGAFKGFREAVRDGESAAKEAKKNDGKTEELEAQSQEQAAQEKDRAEERQSS